MRYITITKACTLLAVCLIFSAPSYSEGNEKANVSSTSIDINDLLDRKVDFYRNLYPDISFMILKGGDELVSDMVQLDIVLGFEPKSLDYEHPLELREDLMYVSANRILQMLQYQMPSASLFKADEPLGWQENVCVLTISPDEFAADSIHSTQSLLGHSQEYVQNIPEDMLLTKEEYLEYVVDHEVYHCLQSLYVGPQKMSDKELWGEYCHYHNELGADAYALGMHIRKAGKITRFAKNIKRIRGTALSTADPNHLTCKATDMLFSMPVKTISDLDEKETFKLAVSIKKQLTIGYDAYLLYMASAVEVMKILGVEAQVSAQAAAVLKDVEADPELVKELTTRTRHCLNELRGG